MQETSAAGLAAGFIQRKRGAAVGTTALFHYNLCGFIA